VVGLLKRSFAKLRRKLRQIIVVYRHWQTCFAAAIEAAEPHINTTERRASLEFAALVRRNCCVCARLRPEYGWCPEEDSNLHTLAGART
jgi:hypothetical protein